MMGPNHAISGSAGWLAATAAYTHYTGNVIEPGVLILGTVVTAGAALAPDIDSFSSTVSNSFGFVSRIFYNIVNILSLGMYNLTKSKNDQPKTNGHRTFFHTTVMAVIAGGLTSLATSLGGKIELWGNTMSWGQLLSLIIMWVMLHLAMGGLFYAIFKRWKAKFGNILLLAMSAVGTWLTASILPENGRYEWLGLAVGLGWFIHLLGDFITKMGVPLLWPIKIKGYRWWNLGLPGFMRISAGGKFEYIIIAPALMLSTALLIIYHANQITGIVK